MALQTQNIARNDLARAFMFRRGIFRCNEEGEFVSCLAVDALAQDRGDVTPIECPSPTRYGDFIEIGTLPGELSRMTTSLSGRMSRTERSLFYDLFINGCPFDLHLHFGLCQRPDAFNQFDKALIFENVLVTSFSTDPLVALQSGDRAVINETIDISIGRYYEVVNLIYGRRGGTVTNDAEIVAVSICDAKSCGSECDDASAGCERIFAVSSDYVGYFSNDGGATWTATVINATPEEGAVVVDATCYKNQFVVVDSEGDFYIVDRSTWLVEGEDAVFGVAPSGLTVAPTAISAVSTYGIVVGEDGTVALFNDPEAGVVVVDAGFAMTVDYGAVYVEEGINVAGGLDGQVSYSYDGEIWYRTSADIPGEPDVTSILAKSRTNWLVGTANGQLWCTENAGQTWARGKYPDSATLTDEVTDIAKATTHVLYMTIGNRLYRSLDGGASWIREPNSAQNFPANSGLNAIAVCEHDPNFVIVGGEIEIAEATYEGFIALGIPQA